MMRTRARTARLAARASLVVPVLAWLPELAAGAATGPPTIEVDLLKDAFQGIALGDPVDELVTKLEGMVDSLERIDVAPPYLPLARTTQTHIIAMGLESVGVEEAAFTFADDALVMVEIRGGAIEGLLPVFEERPVALGAYELFASASVVAHRGKDALWLLSDAALHPNLYLWENPDLPSVTPLTAPYPSSAKRPPFLEFGGELEALSRRIDAACDVTWRQKIDPPWLPSNPAEQTQVNALGFVFAGFPRKIEAVFGDGRLQLAWILTGAGEEDRVRRALVEAYGEPVHVTDDWEAFDGWRVALRKDKPEVLMLAEALVPHYRDQMGAQKD